jgi:hypothetical protein
LIGYGRLDHFFALLMVVWLRCTSSLHCFLITGHITDCGFFGVFGIPRYWTSEISIDFPFQIVLVDLGN